MASRNAKFAVGLFITSGIVLAVFALILLGATKFYKTGAYYVTFFDESVQGLSQDAPVKYRGVPVGRVEKIQVAPDSKLVEVVLKMESDQRLDKNIVAQLKPVGITGSVFIGLDQKREGEPDRSPEIDFPTEYPIVQSKPSEISNLLSGIDAVLKQLQTLNFEGIPEKVALTLDNLNQAVVGADVAGLSQDLRYILKRERWDRMMDAMEGAAFSLKEAAARTNGLAAKSDDLLTRVDNVIDENGKSIQEALSEFKKAMQGARLLAGRGNEIFSRADERIEQLYRYLSATGKNMESASQNLNLLLDQLSSQPSLLLYGSAPEGRR